MYKYRLLSIRDGSMYIKSIYLDSLPVESTSYIYSSYTRAHIISYKHFINSSIN